MAGIRITMQINSRNYTALQQKLVSQLKSAEARQAMNEAVLQTANEFVPRLSGALRDSGYATENSVGWREPYARYQYYGVVYAPNRPVTRGEAIVGWFTKAGTTKYPTDRELGVEHMWHGWRFGYTVDNTSHHWIGKMMRERYRVLQQRITVNLKKRLKG